MLHQNQEIANFQIQIHDLFVELNAESQQAELKAASQRTLRARRGIEDHFEKKRLKRELVDFEFE